MVFSASVPKSMSSISMDTDIQTDIFFIAVLESWDAKMDVKKFLAQSEKKTDGTHYGIIRSEGSSDV